jgi:DNA processing protein
LKRVLTPFSPDERSCWLALHHAPGVAARTFDKLLGLFGGAQAILRAAPGGLAEAGLADDTIAYLRAPDWAAVDAARRWETEPGHHLLMLPDPGYPPLLREIPDPPPVLFVAGDPRVLSSPQLAIVGSRNASPAGQELAYDFARALVQSGLAITSGLALGIDAAAHRGALSGPGPTVAVAGTGLACVYPARHRALAAEIVAAGALISEFPLATPAMARNFPRRNRIISGLSLGTLVIEAAHRSGSLITARHAMEQGRAVLAVPGSIKNPLSRGCHALIRDGAKLVETLEDVLEELVPMHRAVAPPAATHPGQAAASEPDRDGEALDEEYRRLMDCLGHDPASIDVLVARSGLTANVVSSMLLILELRGYVRAEAGGIYVRLEEA